MSAHTKGPWRFVFRGMDEGANWASRIPYAIERPVGNAVQPIADVCDQPEAEANAHLIAAAPDMLQALRRAVLALAFAAESSDAMRDDYNVVSAAIAKATGAPA